MEIKNIVYRKMSDKEKATIEKIIKKASERPHVQIYDCKYVVKYLLENFKEFTYEEQEDCTDMLDVIFDIAKKFEVMNEKKSKTKEITLQMSILMKCLKKVMMKKLDLMYD